MAPTIGETTTAIDNAIAFHYVSHTAPPLIDVILTTASLLLKYKLVTEDVARLCHHAPLYEIKTRSDLEITIDISPGIDRSTFTVSSHSLIGLSPLDLGLAQFVSKSPQKSGKITKPASPSKANQLRLLTNHQDRFTFKQRDEISEKQKLGLLLLERIRLKEKLRKEEVVSTVGSVATHATKIYDIFFAMYSGKLAGYELEKLVTTCRQLIATPISSDDIEKALRYLVERLVQFEWVERRVDGTDKIVIRVVGKLNRGSDLQKLE